MQGYDYGYKVFSATFNNISAILWRSAFIEWWKLEDLIKPPTSHKQTSLSHNGVSSTPRLSGIRTHFSGDSHRLHI